MHANGLISSIHPNFQLVFSWLAYPRISENLEGSENETHIFFPFPYTHTFWKNHVYKYSKGECTIWVLNGKNGQVYYISKMG